MYNLGEQFINSDANKLKSNENSIFCGTKYRITVLTERLLRLEYDMNGMFNDLETSIVKNRLFNVPEFSKKEDDRLLVIETRYFTLTYQKNASFSSKTLVASIPNNKIGWYYGNREVRNLKSCSISLDETCVIPELNQGLFSFDGIATIDDSNSLCFDINSNVVIKEHSKNHVDLYLFIYGKDFGLCLRDYFLLTNNPPLIPRYALGNWWSREYDYNENEVLELIEKFRIKNIPLSIFMLSNWFKKNDLNQKYGFSFNNELFNNPIDFINKVHSSGIKLGLKINPKDGFSQIEDYYSEACKYLKPNKKGIIEFNPYSVRDIDVYLKLFINPLQSIGVDFFWNDYLDNINKMYLLNYYMYKNNSNNNKRYLCLTRNSTIDAHLFNVLYSGNNYVNWDTLRILPFYNLNSSNIGISFWSHDVGGSIGGIEDNDFYLRSLEFAVFSPILRFNTERGKYFKREPWKWDVVTENIASYYLRLRHRLIPYIYSESYNYHKKGTPLIRPFYYNNVMFYDDKNYVNQYYFGSEFMIVPIINPIDEMINRTILRFYIPSGVWYDFKTGKRFLGDHKYISFYSIDDYPIFVKRGSIIPMAGEDSFMSYNNPKTLEIHVFPGESNTYYLYEDDGETNNYKSGKYLITEIDYNYRTSNYTLIIRASEGDLSVIDEKRNYRIVFRNTKKSDHVNCFENEKLIENASVEFNETDFIVNVSNVSVKSQLVVNCYGKDIEIDSIKLIKDDIDSILSDLKINTVLKDSIASIVFNDSLSLGKKRIAIRKLKKRGLDKRSIKIFLRLLDYMEM